MHIRPKTRVQINLVFSITCFWAFCGLFLALYKCVTYDIGSQLFVFTVPQNLPLGSFLLVNLIGPVIGGLVGGGVLVLVLNERLRNRSYGYFLSVSTLFFFVFIVVMNTTVSYFFYYREDIASSAHPLHEALQLLIFDPYAVRNIVTWLVIAFFTLQGLKINEKYGPGTLVSMFLGKYHRPHEVERVFMFLDMSNSTAIAEQLGHVGFFNLLRDFYSDITDPILNSRGEIYQYVGDEIVVSWSLQKAISKVPDCLACFFRIEAVIEKRRSFYMEKYGCSPGFKAAIHKGVVVVGEMGVIKRELVYSGDILNTSARILEKCKIHGEKLIISDNVLQMVHEKMMKGYALHPLGNMSLRGKKQLVELYGLRIN